MCINASKGKYDVVLQCTTQPLAARFVAYFYEDPHKCCFFPADFAEEAEELGPHGPHSGPCLAMFRGLKMEPPQFLAWLQGSLGRRSITRVYFLDRSIPAAENKDGLMRHIVEAGPPPGGVLRVACTPRELETFLQNELPLSFDLNPKSFTHCLQVVTVDGRYRWSVIPADWMYKVSPEEPRSFPGSVAQAVNKVDEAMEVLGLKREGVAAAIDVGAAPGSWTTYVSHFAKLVIAVDPAQLNPSALRPNVVHVQQKSQEAGPAIREALGGQMADLVMCDMNDHPMRCCHVVNDMLQFLRPGGHVIMTLKFFGIGRDRSKVVRGLTEYFKESLEDPHSIWLLANTNHEQTFVARKRAA